MTTVTDYIIPFECHDCGAQWFANENRKCSHDTTPFERLIEDYNWFPKSQAERDREARFQNTKGTSEVVRQVQAAYKECAVQVGIITWQNGSRSFMRHGIVTDILPESESEIKCTKCTWTGFSMDLVCIDYAPDGSTYACPVCESAEIADIPMDAPQPEPKIDYLAQAKQSFITTCICFLVGGIAFGFYLATVIQGGVK